MDGCVTRICLSSKSPPFLSTQPIRVRLYCKVVGYINRSFRSFLHEEVADDKSF